MPTEPGKTPSKTPSAAVSKRRNPVLSALMPDRNPNPSPEEISTSSSSPKRKKPPKNSTPASVRETRNSAKKQRKRESTPPPPPPPPPAEAPSKKRKKRNREKEEGRKRKKKSEEPADPPPSASKKPNFDRIWSEENEIKLLRAMIDCGKDDGGGEPMASIDRLTEIVRRKLNLPFTRNQVYDKIRRLKRRWDFARGRSKDTRGAPAKPHDRTVFELCQKIWKPREPPTREKSNPSTAPRPKRTPPPPPPLPAGSGLEKIVTLMEEENGDPMTKGMTLEGFKKLDPATVKELEGKLHAHLVQGLKHSLRESRLKSEIQRACAEALERRGF